MVPDPQSPQAPDFSPRPWPRRAKSDSPLAGRRVLVVSQDLGQARRIGEELSLFGLITQASAGGEDLLRHLAGEPWQAVLVDPRDLLAEDLEAVEGGLTDGAPLLLFGDAQHDDCPLQARSFSQIPGESTGPRIHTALGRAFEHSLLQLENQRLRERLDGRFQLGNVVTRDPGLERLLTTLEAVADTRANVLLSGESGTGKTMLARTMHGLSDRKDRPFVVVNCGALPDSLLESELFGHARGAFTGAVKDKPGRFEEADGGTIFLDEINSASLDLQVKLLRVIQERTFERVGESRSRTVDVRIVTATNADLQQEIAEGRFREDLFYRIHVVALELPPLRERTRDILLLAESFLARFARDHGRELTGIDEACRAALVRFPWPGNVRQLENTIERAVLLARGPLLTLPDLGEEVRSHAIEQNPSGLAGFELHGAGLELGLANLSSLPSLKEALEGPERAILVRALELCEGNRTRAAEMLEINRSTLFHKMRKYDLLERNFRPARGVT